MVQMLTSFRKEGNASVDTLNDEVMRYYQSNRTTLLNRSMLATNHVIGIISFYKF